MAFGGGLVRSRSGRPHVGIAAGLGRRQRSICSRKSPSRTARAGFCRAAARRNTRRGSVPSNLCARLVAVAVSTPPPPPHAVGARGFCGSLPWLLLAVHGLSRKGRTPGLADDEGTPHLGLAAVLRWRCRRPLAATCHLDYLLGAVLSAVSVLSKIDRGRGCRPHSGRAAAPLHGCAAPALTAGSVRFQRGTVEL